jgi:tRNA(Arg) A34 adenosine deaminase TadA
LSDLSDVSDELKEEFMRLAIREARKNLRDLWGGPFGACIVRDGEVLAVARNLVLKKDATCHAEINAIRAASRKLGAYDLSGCQIYSTTEPCPMCFAAIHWARLGLLVYGTSIEDVRKLGFNELTIPNATLRALGGAKTPVLAGFMIDECRQLLQDWEKLKNKPVY